MENKRLVKVYIVDDDVNAAKLLIMQLKNYSVEIVGQAQDATEETKNEIVELEPDMVFLDVEMPSMSGLSFWSTIQPAVKPNTKVVFYTGYDKYMLEALRRQAFDFLLKPASQPELAQVMMRYYENKLSNIQAALPQSDDYQPSVMVVNALNEHTVLRFDDIAFFRFDSVRRIWEVITINRPTSSTSIRSVRCSTTSACCVRPSTTSRSCASARTTATISWLLSIVCKGICFSATKKTA